VTSTTDGISVTRIGTQVVVRLAGDVGDARADRLAAAVDEVATLVIQRVVVDLDEVTSIEGAGLDFLAELHRRWRLRLVNTPAGLRAALPRQAMARPATA
jgi:anti-anti-sigma regulatory factor